VPRLLVIDDSAVIRGLAAVLLGRHPGWEVETAESGQAGVAVARAAPPDGILLDLDMPGLDGPATLAELRRHPPCAHVPVAFFTGAADELPPERLLALGATAVIAKPLSPATAVAAVADAFGWSA
jgi:CheY-like chemotaxis protein